MSVYMLYITVKDNVKAQTSYKERTNHGKRDSAGELSGSRYNPP